MSSEKKVKKEIKYMWYDGKLHTTSIHANEEPVDLNELKDWYEKQMEEKEDTCKKIYHLGVALTGNPAAARGFLVGWLVRSLKDPMEEKAKAKWNIQHTEDTVSEEEIKGHLVSSLRDLANVIENDNEYKIKKKPLLTGDVDGTELF